MEKELFFVRDIKLCDPLIVHKSTPQGSTLSPILFNLYLHDIASCLGDNVEILMVHLKYVINKGRKIVNIIAALTGVWWGSHPQSLLSFYRAVLRGSIEYGIAGYRVSTPINVMLAEAGKPPLRIKFNYLAARYLIKNFSRCGSLPIDSLEHLETASHNPRLRLDTCQRVPIFKRYNMVKHFKSCIKRSRFLAAFLYPFSTTIFTMGYTCVFAGVKDDTSNELILKLFQEFLHPLIQRDYVCFYTDSSRFDPDNFTGAGIYSPLAVIFSDSKSVLDYFASTRLDFGNYLIYAIINQLSQVLSKNLSIKLAWIPSHKGIAGNEKADELAKLGAKQGDRIDLEIPYSNLLSEARTSAAAQYRSHLDEEFRTKGLHYDQHFRSQTLVPWFTKLSLNREEIVLINRLRSNHYYLNYSLYRKNIVASKACPCGDPQQDINHIIFHCPFTSPKSEKLISFINNISDIQNDIFPLLKNYSPKLIRLLLAFLKSNNLSL
ncbi:hypothetical protein ALC57_05877 [Trachymyrmex cornetzi]|uniref:RNase H type-1 domain-containing protein n=1 Tax=Trachymyrmex cornetzi TaxID=471704 RepID=A0A151J9W6_9HYME|nr:hypothetical protein ALC57_05877 [Trachymyrmex cornetzi]